MIIQNTSHIHFSISRQCVCIFHGHPGEVVTTLWLFVLSLPLSCNKHWEGNNDMSLKETGFEDVHLNLLAQ